MSLDIVGQDRDLLFTTPKNATDARYTDAKFIGYSGTTFGTNATGILRLFRSGSTNPELQLSYSGFGNLARSGPTGHLNFGQLWFGYGIETRMNDIPASGTATYSGVLHGFAADPVAGKQYRLEGTSSFVLDFALRKVSGTFDLTLISDNGTRISVGPASFSDSTFGSPPGSTSVPTNFGATPSGPQVPEAALGALEAMLYGPGAIEIAGRLRGSIAASSAHGEIHFVSAFAAVKN